MISSRKKKGNNINDQYSILRFFYFILIFSVLIYLFCTLFEIKEGKVIKFVDSFSSNELLHDTWSNSNEHKIIMDFPEFIILKKG
jgi:hypothetical protein